MEDVRAKERPAGVHIEIWDYNEISMSSKNVEHSLKSISGDEIERLPTTSHYTIETTWCDGKTEVKRTIVCSKFETVF